MKMHEMLALKEEQSKAKALQNQAKVEEQKQAKKVTDARKAADAAIDLLKNPLKDSDGRLQPPPESNVAEHIPIKYL